MHRLYGRNRSDRDTVDASVVIQGGARARIGQESDKTLKKTFIEWSRNELACGIMIIKLTVSVPKMNRDTHRQVGFTDPSILYSTLQNIQIT